MIPDNISRPKVPFAPQRVLTLGEQISIQFVHALVNGSLKPHDKLPSEIELADQFGVSRKTMRDALEDLRKKGFIKSSPGKSGGTYICAYSYDQLASAVGKTLSIPLNLEDISLEQIEEVRMIIEIYCADIITEKINADKSSVNFSLMTESEHHYTQPHDCFFDFHTSIAKETDNPILTSIITSMHLILSTLFASEIYPVKEKRDAYNSHLKLYNALMSGDKEIAEKEMREHILITNQLINSHKE